MWVYCMACICVLQAVCVCVLHCMGDFCVCVCVWLAITHSVSVIRSGPAFFLHVERRICHSSSPPSLLSFSLSFTLTLSVPLSHTNTHTNTHVKSFVCSLAQVLFISSVCLHFLPLSFSHLNVFAATQLIPHQTMRYLVTNPHPPS